MRISYVQAKESLSKANPKRQHSKNAVSAFQEQMGEFVDLMASIIEKSLPPATTGRGSRLEPSHVHEQIMLVELQMMKEWFINTEERMK